jgi:hypothetical protein
VSNRYHRDGRGWADDVQFDEDGGFAYRPDQVLVAAAGAEDVPADFLEERRIRRTGERTGSFQVFSLDALAGNRSRPRGSVVRAVHDLRVQGVLAQPNHVLFSHAVCSCCGPHPALRGVDPFHANPFHANPFHANPFHANPFHANPFHANPFGSNAHGGSPFPVDPLHALRYACDPRQAAELRASGRRRNGAQPAAAPVLPDWQGDVESRTRPSIVVIDTGLAAREVRPDALFGLGILAEGHAEHDEGPDEDGDQELDPVAGHGTFIAGLIERIAPGCEVRVNGLLTNYGDASERDVADTLESLLGEPPGPPDLVNLSFGGYALADMERLAEAVRKLQDAGAVVVASAGNDATCRPAYPAALPGVVSVAALGPHGPAPFTNYGPWVRACAPGVDVVSTFFRWRQPSNGQDYAEWVSWSGTSFAAPAVTAALARAMREGLSAEQAVERLIDAPRLLRLTDLGTVVNQDPWWQVRRP